MLVVALAGIARERWPRPAVLARASRESLNVRGAFLHVATDMRRVRRNGGRRRADPRHRLGPLRPDREPRRRGADAVGELGPAARVGVDLPRALAAAIDPEAVGRALVAEPDVVEVHDLHVWTVTSGFPALAAHVLVAPDADCHAIRRHLEQMLHERFGLEHTTLQVEHAEPRLLTIERR